MDKNEFRALTDKVEKLLEEGKTKAALDLLDGTNWRKVHNVNALMKVAEIYENAGRLDDAKELLWMAHDRSRVARAVIYRLALICIKMEEYDEAQEFLEEYIELAPHDSLQYVIRYELSKAKGSDDATLIAILEELKNNDFLEDRAYELALLYKKTGQIQKCEELCDEIILWFGEGPYVEKAMELKKTIGSLSAEQEELYQKLKYSKEDGVREISLPEKDEMPQVTVATDRFATVNLQEEIKKNIAEIIGTSEDGGEEAVHTYGALMNNIPYSMGSGDTKEIRIGKKEIDLTAAEEKKQTIEDAVRAMDATLRETEEALADMDEEQKEQVRAEALAEAAEITERIQELSLRLEAGLKKEDREEEAALRSAADSIHAMAQAFASGNNDSVDYKKAGELVGEVNELLQKKIDRLAAEAAAFAEPEAEPAAVEAEEIPAAAEIEAASAVEEIPVVSDEVKELSVPEEVSDEENTEEAEAAEEELSENAEGAEAVDIVDPNTETAEDTPDPDMSWAERPEELAAEQAKREKKTEEPKEEKKPGKKEKLDPLQEAFKRRETIAQWTYYDEVPDDVFNTKYSPETNGEQFKLTAEEKEVFDYMAPIDGMETKVGGALACAKDFYNNPRNINGHIIISGNAGSGRTTLAMGLVQVLQKEIHKPRGPIGRINAQKLNEKDILDVFRKVKSGVLIIEKAGSMHKQTVNALNTMMRTDRSNILVIIEDTREEIAKLLRNNKDFADRFGRQIDIPIFTIDELVNFAKSYAKEKECTIDDMALLELYTRINHIQRQDHATTLSDVQVVMDDAIASASKRGPVRFFRNIGTKKKDSEGRLILHEKDFAAK